MTPQTQSPSLLLVVKGIFEPERVCLSAARPNCSSACEIINAGAATLHVQAKRDFEELIASLKICKEQQPSPLPAAAPSSQADGPLSPQSFAMVSWSQNGERGVSAEVLSPSLMGPVCCRRGPWS